VPPLIVQATISFPVAILAEAGLSYLSLGANPCCAIFFRERNCANSDNIMPAWPIRRCWASAGCSDHRATRSEIDLYCDR